MAAFSGINEEVGVGDGRVGRFGQSTGNGGDSFVVAFYAEARDVWVFTFSEDVAGRVQTGADRAPGWWGRAGSFVLESVGELGIEECSKPVAHNDAAPSREDVGVVDIVLGVWEEMFLRGVPRIVVNPSDRGGVVFLGEASDVFL